MKARMITAQVLLVVSLILTPIYLSGCSLSERQQVIQTTFAVTNAARDKFVAYDAAHQKEIVVEATDEASGKAALAAYRSKRAQVMELFEGVYHAIAVVTLSDNAPLADLLPSATHLKNALDEFMKRLP